MPNADDRARAIATASELFRRQGYAATGLTQVIEESSTPKGSFYFNFPGGKAELGVEALRYGGSLLRGGIEGLAAAAPERGEFVRLLADAMAAGLEATEFEAGCPIATVALETATISEPLRIEADAQFRGWEEEMATVLGDDAGLVLAALEGGLVLSRARRSGDPLRDVGARLARLLAS